MSQEPLIFIALEPLIDSAGQLVRTLAKGKQFELMNVPSPAEALQAAQQFQPCVLVVSIRGSLDGQPQVDMLKKLEKQIRGGTVKALVLSSVKNHPLSRAVAAVGVTDYVEEPVPMRSLLFKMNLIVKAVQALKKQQEEQKTAEPVVFKSDEEKRAAGEVTVSGGARSKYKPALQLGEDTFVFKGALPKKAGKKFVLEVEGPLPESGAWQEERSEKGKQQKWRWEPKLTEGMPEKTAADDGWVHEGEEPVFDAETGKWKLRSERPQLYYRKGGKKIASKVETDDNAVVALAQDSTAARDNLMLNKTLVEQEREEAVKRATLGVKKRVKKRGENGQEIEEEAGPENPASGTQTAATEEEERAALAELEKRTGEEEEKNELAKKKREKKGSGEGEEAEGGEEEEEKRAPAELDVREREGEAAAKRDQRGEDGEQGSGAANLELHTREERLEGLKKEDLEGEQNLNGPARSESEHRVGKEDLPEGLSQEQLESDQNLRQEKEGKAAPKLNAGELDEEEEGEGEGAAEGGEGESEEAKAKRAALKKKKPVKPREDPAIVAAKEKAAARARERLAKLKKDLEDSMDPAVSLSEEDNPPPPPGSPPETPEEKQERERLARIRKREKTKREMQDLQDSLDGKGKPLLELLAELEEKEEKEERPPLEGEDKERNFRAIDSIDEDAQEDFFGSGEGGPKKKKPKKKAALSANEEQTDEDEADDLGALDGVDEQSPENPRKRKKKRALAAGSLDGEAKDEAQGEGGDEDEELPDFLNEEGSGIEGTGDKRGKAKGKKRPLAAGPEGSEAEDQGGETIDLDERSESEKEKAPLEALAEEDGDEHEDEGSEGLVAELGTGPDGKKKAAGKGKKKKKLSAEGAAAGQPAGEETAEGDEEAEIQTPEERDAERALLEGDEPGPAGERAAGAKGKKAGKKAKRPLLAEASEGEEDGEPTHAEAGEVGADEADNLAQEETAVETVAGEFAFSARELLALVAIADAKRRHFASVATVIKAIALAFPDLRCDYREPGQAAAEAAPTGMLLALPGAGAIAISREGGGLSDRERLLLGRIALVFAAARKPKAA
jgi:DNA-binding NarL/FixJ family response regulator